MIWKSAERIFFSIKLIIPLQQSFEIQVFTYFLSIEVVLLQVIYFNTVFSIRSQSIRVNKIYQSGSAKTTFGL